MEINSKEQLLEHYSEREPKQFVQIDCFFDCKNHDGISAPDDDGDDFYFCQTHELMYGAGVRVLIPAGETTRQQAARALGKMVEDLRNRPDLFQGLKEEDERGPLDDLEGPPTVEIKLAYVTEKMKLMERRAQAHLDIVMELLGSDVGHETLKLLLRYLISKLQHSMRGTVAFHNFDDPTIGPGSLSAEQMIEAKEAFEQERSVEDLLFDAWSHSLSYKDLYNPLKRDEYWPPEDEDGE